MFSFLRPDPQRRVQRSLTRAARAKAGLEVAFDGMRAIVSCADTGRVVVSEDVSRLAESHALPQEIEARLRRWLALLADEDMDPGQLLPLVRPIPDRLGANEPWSQPLGGDLCLYAALLRRGALIPVTEPQLARQGLSHASLRSVLEANWTTRNATIDIWPRPQGVVEVTVRDTPEFSASLMICNSLQAVATKLGWSEPVLILPGRRGVLMVEGTHPDAENRLRRSQDRWDGEPISARIWQLPTQGERVSPLSAAA